MWQGWCKYIITITWFTVAVTSEIRASFSEDMNSRGAIATDCHLFSLASATLLAKCSSTACKVSVIAFFFPRWSQHDSLSLPPHTNDQEAADKQAWSRLPARASVLHARSLFASKQDIPIYLPTCVCPLRCVWGGGTRVYAGRWHAGRSLRHYFFS